MSGQTSYLPQKSGEGEEEGEGYRRHGACISVLVYVSVTALWNDILWMLIGS